MGSFADTYVGEWPTFSPLPLSPLIATSELCSRSGNLLCPAAVGSGPVMLLAMPERRGADNSDSMIGPRPTAADRSILPDREHSSGLG